MKVLLCSPESEVWNSRAHIHMGLGYLAGSLRAGGHGVEIYDAGIETVPLAEVMANGQFDVVGISAPTPLIYEAWDVAAEAKRLGAVTILGGPHLTLMPTESMAKPQVDLVVVGEAEDTILEVMDALNVDPGQCQRRRRAAPVRGAGVERHPRPVVAQRRRRGRSAIRRARCARTSTTSPSRPSTSSRSSNTPTCSRSPTG